MAVFVFPVARKGHKGVEVHADLLDEAWDKLRRAIDQHGRPAHLDELVTGDPVRVDARSVRHQGVTLAECMGVDRP
jgi:hypothetical protein